MHYAVTLEFDKESEQKIQEMIDEVALVTGCDHMKRSKIPPHITVCALIGEDEGALISELDDIAADLKKNTVFFSNIGVFNPLVIYLGPMMNEFLLETCKTMNERLLKIAEVGNKGRYRPYHWVPHAGIAVKLTPEALQTAFAIVQKKFTPFEAKVERLVFANGEPYEELKAWDLQ